MSRSEGSPGLRVLLAGAIDYAGLFPPAGLSLPEAVANYGEYRRSSDHWALGRFVVATDRLPELADRLFQAEPAGWRGARVSATAGPSLGAAVEAVVRFNGRLEGRAIAVDALEAKMADGDAIEHFTALLPNGVVGYAEIPPGGDQDGLLERLGRHGLNAKLRMGGVTRDLFPSGDGVAAFLAAVAARRVPFKATAGLHHPVRGEYRLTYDEGSPRAPMYGFLNLAVATMVALDGGPRDRIVAALQDDDPTAFAAEGSGLRWRDRRFGAAGVEGLRRSFHGFGSCSFREPIDELEPALAR